MTTPPPPTTTSPDTESGDETPSARVGLHAIVAMVAALGVGAPLMGARMSPEEKAARKAAREAQRDPAAADRRAAKERRRAEAVRRARKEAA